MLYIFITWKDKANQFRDVKIPLGNWIYTKAHASLFDRRYIYPFEGGCDFSREWPPSKGYV